LLVREVADLTEDTVVGCVWMAAADGVAGDDVALGAASTLVPSFGCDAIEEWAELAVGSMAANAWEVRIRRTLGGRYQGFKVVVNRKRRASPDDRSTWSLSLFAPQAWPLSTYRGHSIDSSVVAMPAPVGAGFPRQVFKPNRAVVVGEVE